MKELRDRLQAEIAQVVVGAEGSVDALLTAAILGGHILLEGPPGTAKTLLASEFARACGGRFRRVQFTPDMLPADLTGTMTLRGGELVLRRGPVFGNVLLADEINRTPPKTQAALLEAMQEGQVSIDGESHPLPSPFLVVATQNPIEFEGTYPLPEAQLDRFLMRVEVGYPTEAQELALAGLSRAGLGPPRPAAPTVVLDPPALARARAQAQAVSVAPEVLRYAVAIVRRTRELPSVTLGASPRAGVHLLAAARVAAQLAGRDFVVPDDVAAVAGPVLAHRLGLGPEAELDRFTAGQAVAATLESVPVPR